MSTSSLFQRVVCVNLDRRGDRWTQFQAGLPSDWPFPPPVRVRAVDGTQVPVPEGWVSGGGAWGCMQSHRRILEDALLDGIESILVLEDDAYFPEGFTGEVLRFLEKVPADWDCIMLGGQHIQFDKKPPIVEGPGVLRCVNCQRTHAYALKRPAIQALYKRWHSWEKKTTGHCDHIMGPFMGRMKTYAPSDRRGKPRMLVGQAPSKSDIALGKDGRLCFWDPPDPMMPVLLVESAERPRMDEWRRLGYHGGYWVNQETGVDQGLVNLLKTPRGRLELVDGVKKWVDTLRWEAASVRPSCSVAVWLGPYHSKEAVDAFRTVCGALLKEVQEVPGGREQSAVGVRAAVGDRGQTDVKKRRGQGVRRRGGGGRRK